MLELENRDSVMKKESEINPTKKEHHKYIPPSNHPWRKNMMLNINIGALPQTLGFNA